MTSRCPSVTAVNFARSALMIFSSVSVGRSSNRLPLARPHGQTPKSTASGSTTSASTGAGSERVAVGATGEGETAAGFTSRMRRNWAKTLDMETATLEVQGLAFGDVCFVGVPGELVNEIGLEIKWNSPFARTFVAYCATGFFGYICPANLQAAGGYEPQDMRFASRDTLKLVSTACDAMFDLRDRLHPEDRKGADPYPDDRELPLVNLPGGVKASKWQH